MESLHYEAVELIFKACPFCGNLPNVFQVPDKRYGASGAGWVIECKEMGCMFKRSMPYQVLSHLAGDWNARRSQ